MKIVNINTFEEVAEIITNCSMTLDQAIELVGEFVERDEDHLDEPDVLIGDKYYFYEELDLAGDNWISRPIITVTMISLYAINQNKCPISSSYEELVAVGYDEEKARDAAIQAIRNACQSNFAGADPTKAGYACWFASASAVALAEDEDEDDVSTSYHGYDVFTMDDKRYAVPADWDESYYRGCVYSMDIRAEEEE